MKVIGDTGAYFRYYESVMNENDLLFLMNFNDFCDKCKFSISQFIFPYYAMSMLA